MTDMVLTLAGFKDFADITSDNKNDRLTARLLSSYRLAESKTERSFGSEAYSPEYHNGNKSSVIFLKNAPVTVLTKIVMNDTELTEGRDNDFILDYASGEVLFNGLFGSGLRAIEVYYTAGWTADSFPKDLADAIYSLVMNKDKKIMNSVLPADSELMTFTKKEITEVLDKYHRGDVII